MSKIHIRKGQSPTYPAKMRRKTSVRMNIGAVSTSVTSAFPGFSPKLPVPSAFNRSHQA